MQIESNVKIVRCIGEDCGRIATHKIVINRKPVYMCKNCLGKLYDCVGRAVIPKSPGNFLNDEKLQKSGFDSSGTAKL